MPHASAASAIRVSWRKPVQQNRCKCACMPQRNRRRHAPQLFCARHGSTAVLRHDPIQNEEKSLFFRAVFQGPGGSEHYRAPKRESGSCAQTVPALSFDTGSSCPFPGFPAGGAPCWQASTSMGHTCGRPARAANTCACFAMPCCTCSEEGERGTPSRRSHLRAARAPCRCRCHSCSHPGSRSGHGNPPAQQASCHRCSRKHHPDGMH